MHKPPDFAILAWAIFLAEGACKASVPFGYLPLKSKYRRKEATFFRVMQAVIKELKLEWRRYEKSNYKSFIRYLARVGYNANPAEWDDWERNVRMLYNYLKRKFA